MPLGHEAVAGPGDTGHLGEIKPAFFFTRKCFELLVFCSPAFCSLSSSLGGSGDLLLPPKLAAEL